MFQSIIEAWRETVAAANKVMSRFWGDQTSDEAKLEKRGEEAQEQIRQWDAKVREANFNGDIQAKNAALLALNSWQSELKRVQDEAASKRA